MSLANYRKAEYNRWFTALVVGLGLALSGCDGCGSKKPYTPFGVASGLPPSEAPSAVAEPAPPPAESGAFAARKAELVPNAPQSWQGQDLKLEAPAGRRFVQVLPSDFDGDQTLDALAWLVPAAGEKNAPPGELWYFPAAAPPRLLTALPGFVPSGPDCTLSTTLTQTGARSATLDASATCRSTLIARAPSRALIVVSPSVEHPLLLTLRAAAPAPDETVTFSVDSSDQDKDGRDDVRLTVSLAAPGSADPSTANLVWLDRAAGASRSSSEPGASLTRLAGKLGLVARSKRGGNAIERINTTLRLLSTLCAEGGVARLFDEEGAPFRCGDLSKTIDSLAMSEALAALMQADPLQAFSVLARDGWYFGKLSNAQRKSIERELVRAVSKLEAGAPHAARVQPAPARGPHFSPLWFENDGALLVQNGAGVTRISADRASEEAINAEAGTPTWPLELATPEGRRVLGLVHACDRNELVVNQSDAQHPLLPTPTRLAAARPASCSGHGMGPAVTIAPLGFDENGVEALIAGARISLPVAGKKPVPGLPVLGTPRSADGHWLVTPTDLGLLVVGERKELWQTDKLTEHAAAGRYSDCVVANEARAVACIDAGRVIVFERPKQTTTSSTHNASTPSKK